jgi:hypothetical protein
MATPQLFCNAVFKKAAFDNLQEVTTVLKRYGMDSCILCGTLLGYHRNGDLIPMDHDVDLGVLSSDFNPSYENELYRLGYELYDWNGCTSFGYEKSFIKNGVAVDIWVINEAEDRMCLCVGKEIFYEYDRFEFEPINWNGIMTHKPSDTEKHIERHYGPDWKIPDTNKKWHWKRSPLHAYHYIEYIEKTKHIYGEDIFKQYLRECHNKGSL